MSTNISIAKNSIQKKEWKGKFVNENIEISNPYGSISLRYGGDHNLVEYIATIQKLDSNILFEVENSKKDEVLSITINKLLVDKTISDTSKSRVDLTLFIPKNKHVWMKTINGEIEAKGLIADVNIETKGGDILLSKINGIINTTNNFGKTVVTLVKLKTKQQQSFNSITGDISVWVNRKSNYLIEASTSYDIITDFSLVIDDLIHKEPSKKATIKLNNHSSKIIIKTKRGVTAIRGFGEY